MNHVQSRRVTRDAFDLQIWKQSKISDRHHQHHPFHPNINERKRLMIVWLLSVRLEAAITKREYQIFGVTRVHTNERKKVKWVKKAFLISENKCKHFRIFFSLKKPKPFICVYELRGRPRVIWTIFYPSPAENVRTRVPGQRATSYISFMRLIWKVCLWTGADRHSCFRGKKSGSQRGRTCAIHILAQTLLHSSRHNLVIIAGLLRVRGVS